MRWYLAAVVLVACGSSSAKKPPPPTDTTTTYLGRPIAGTCSYLGADFKRRSGRPP